MATLPAGHVWATWKPIWSVHGPDMTEIRQGDKRAIPEGEALESDHWDYEPPVKTPEKTARPAEKPAQEAS